METQFIVLGVLTCAILIYLAYSLLYPEKF